MRREQNGRKVGVYSCVCILVDTRLVVLSLTPLGESGVLPFWLFKEVMPIGNNRAVEEEEQKAVKNWEGRDNEQSSR